VEGGAGKNVWGRRAGSGLVEEVGWGGRFSRDKAIARKKKNMKFLSLVGRT